MAEDVADLLGQIGRAFRGRLSRLPLEGGPALTAPQRDVLAKIGRKAGRAPHEVAEASGRDRGQVTRIVNELAAMGLVSKTRSQEDRRAISLHLSAEGEAVFARMLAQRAGLSAAMLADMSEPERTALKGSLRKIAAALRAL